LSSFGSCCDGRFFVAGSTLVSSVAASLGGALKLFPPPYAKRKKLLSDFGFRGSDFVSELKSSSVFLGLLPNAEAKKLLSDFSGRGEADASASNSAVSSAFSRKAKNDLPLGASLDNRRMGASTSSPAFELEVHPIVPNQN